MTAREQILDLKQRISAAVIGQEPVVEQLLIALLANGHLLMEGLPGLAKDAHHQDAGEESREPVFAHSIHARFAAK